MMEKQPRRYLVTLHMQDISFAPPVETPEGKWELVDIKLSDRPAPYGIDDALTLIVIWGAAE